MRVMLKPACTLVRHLSDPFPPVATAGMRRLLRRNGDHGHILVGAGFPQGKEEHDGRERSLRFPVAIVDPEPVIPVMHGGISGRRLVLPAVNPHGLRVALGSIVPDRGHGAVVQQILLLKLG